MCRPADKLVSSFSNADVRCGQSSAGNQAIPDNILFDVPAAILDGLVDVSRSYDSVTFRGASVDYRTRMAQQVLHMFRYEPPAD
jgi:hypothetical protein